MSRALIIKGADFSVNRVAKINRDVPYDSEVTYLQGDGTAFIDTGVKPSSNMTFYASVNISTPSSNTAIFGARDDTYVGNYTLYYDKSDTYIVLRYGSTIADAKVSHGNATGDFIISTSEQVNKMVVTGAASGIVNLPAETFSTGCNLCMFCSNTTGDGYGPATNGVVIKYKALKLYNGGILVRDFIPVRIGQVGYMYDKVSGELFGNAAETGAFIFGADK